MTQYMLSVQHTGPYADLDSPEAQAMFARTGAFDTQLREAGQWVFVGGLHSVETATVVDSTQGEVIVTDGAFAESKEHLAGFWIIEAADLDEALKLAAQASTACQDPVQVRAFQQV